MNLQKAFKTIGSQANNNKYIVDICNLIYENKLETTGVNEVLKKYNISKTSEIKEELLDLILSYIKLVLKDNVLTSEEENNVRLLKLLFSIEEGDFLKYHSTQIAEILKIELLMLYRDKFIDDKEALKKGSLQRLFDLSYDQFLTFVNIEDIKALETGANYDDLQTFIKPEKPQ
jgi:hypothetical protein